MLDFLLGEGPKTGRPVEDVGRKSTHHTNGDNTRLQERRRNKPMSGASRRGPRAKSLLATETNEATGRSSGASGSGRAAGVDSSSDRQLRDILAVPNGSVEQNVPASPSRGKDATQEDSVWYEYGCV